MNPNKRKHFVIRFVSAAVFIASLSGFAGSIYALVKMQSLHVNSMAPEAVREYVLMKLRKNKFILYFECHLLIMCPTSAFPEELKIRKHP
ncbi:hypothetical protein PT160_02645 [Erysipelothrix rhusiopathiae]|nr:hypothetical protein [Erysipelothrix rhusiopathiae]MDE8281540.1 hypothetical protein [Erysipelothrix rhusiopathiae]MDE8322376.1 hypothetical protein [Erysipelothrix rhusiopathiae]